MTINEPVTEEFVWISDKTTSSPDSEKTMPIH